MRVVTNVGKSEIWLNDELAKLLDSYDVQINRFANRDVAYVMERTIIVHPDVFDVLAGYGRIRRWIRKRLRAIKWWFQRRGVRRSIANDSR